MTAQGNNIKSYKFDANPDHTHFIIYDDLAVAAHTANAPNKETAILSSMINLNCEDGLMNYDQFRNRIESLFTRSLTYYKRRLFKLSKNLNYLEIYRYHVFFFTINLIMLRRS